MTLVGAILTGGASRRFGSDKALAPVTSSGITMGAQIIGELRAVGADPVVAVGGNAGHSLEIPIIADPVPDLGPLSGLASVLSWAGRGFVLIVPCDVPLLRANHLRPLVQAALHQTTMAAKQDGGHQKGVASIIATIDGKPQPSIGCWNASAGLALQRAVTRGDRTLFRSLELVPWTPIEIDPAALADADDPDTLATLVEDA